MRNWWIRFGCFLTGYNYAIVATSSEVAAKAIKRYTAAMLIVCILWAFVGYTFTGRYLHGGVWASLAGAALMMVIIIQIERQIILSIEPPKKLLVARGIIAVLMALIGSVIIDQTIFKEDIELEQVTLLEERVKKALPPKTEELRRQIAALDTAIGMKEREHAALVSDLDKHPTIKRILTKQDPLVIPAYTAGARSVVRKINTVSVIEDLNPKYKLVEPLNESIAGLRKEKAGKENALLTIRPRVEKEIRSHTGFLDELEVMIRLITGSFAAAFIWLAWFLFLMGLELLVLLSKSSEKKNDYEATVLHQMDFQLQRLRALARLAEGRK